MVQSGGLRATHFRQHRWKRSGKLLCVTWFNWNSRKANFLPSKTSLDRGVNELWKDRMIEYAEEGQAWGSEGKSRGMLNPGDSGVITRERKQRQK